MSTPFGAGEAVLSATTDTAAVVPETEIAVAPKLVALPGLLSPNFATWMNGSIRRG